MNRLSFSRQPSAYIGLVAAVLVVLTTVGIDVPPGLQAAIDGLIVAIGTVLTWTQVRPAAHSINVGIAPVVHVSAESPGTNEHEYRRYVNGRLEERSKTSFTMATASAGLVPPVPIKAHPKKAAPVKKAAKKRSG